jgi:hypothetical protein
MRGTVLLFALASSIAAAGCAVDGADDGASLEIPLVQSGADGAVYRLRDASFEVTAPGGAVEVIDGDVDVASVSLPVTPGTYSIRLVAGWVLERSVDGTSFESLDAVLGAQNPQVVHVFPDVVQPVVFRFYVRDDLGALEIAFGVVPAPQKLFGTLSFVEATGVLGSYAGRSVDYVNYFDGAQQRLETEADGTRVRHYLATGIGTEFFNDPIGIFAGVVAPQAAGGTLDMKIRALPDGSQELVGAVITFTGNPTSFGPTPVVVGLDAAGFPLDAAFDVVGPFTLVGPQSTAAGRTTLRHTVD